MFYIAWARSVFEKGKQDQFAVGAVAVESGILDDSKPITKTVIN